MYLTLLIINKESASIPFTANHSANPFQSKRDRNREELVAIFEHKPRDMERVPGELRIELAKLRVQVGRIFGQQR